MNSACACIATVAAALLTAQPPTQDTPAATDDSLTVWRQRAERAQAWLKARATDAEQAANTALARARVELLGVDAPVADATLSLATRPDADQPTIKWAVFDELTTLPDPLPSPVVILIHGLDEPGTIWDELTPHLLEHRAAVIRFDYPNDQGLVESSAELAAALRTLHARGITRVSIVAHSMGGLVAREALTSPAAYAGNGAGTADLPAIDHLIMCGTPNHGSPFAGLQAVAEAREQVVRRVQGTSANGSGLVSARIDGNGEAARDLAKGSDFLTALNARPNPTHTRMTTIRALVTPTAAIDYLKTEAATQWAAYIGEDRASALTSQACAAMETLGDGVVPIDSVRLDGVNDHVEIAADHRSMLKRWTILVKLDELRGLKTPPAAAIPVILARLGLKGLSEKDAAEQTAQPE